MIISCRPVRELTLSKKSFFLEIENRSKYDLIITINEKEKTKLGARKKMVLSEKYFDQGDEVRFEIYYNKRKKIERQYFVIIFSSQANRKNKVVIRNRNL
ncbi:MAG: hypothetical protein WC928_00480 [Patescibacteria group bacterium]|jgi:DNA-directed RNA polymerase subunit E'/Rpb7